MSDYPYSVRCCHPGCNWSVRIDLDEPVEGWEPADWNGQPLADAYSSHYVQVHAQQGQPPMYGWSAV